MMMMMTSKSIQICVFMFPEQGVVYVLDIECSQRFEFGGSKPMAESQGGRLVAAREARKECFAPALARANSTSEHQSITLSKIGDCIV